VNLLNQLVSKPIGAFGVLALAAFLEVYGDSCFQSGMYRTTGMTRIMWLLAGIANVPQWDFGKLLGVYVAIFFVVAQIVAKVRFHQSPTPAIYAGGALIVAGGAVITFWKP